MRTLTLLAALAACDAGGGSRQPLTSCEPVAAPVAVTIAPTPPPPPVVSPPAPAAVEPSVPLSYLVLPIPPMPVSPRRVARNDYVDGALETAARGGPGDYGVVSTAVFGVIADPSNAKARFVEACLLAQLGEHLYAKLIVEVLHDAPRCAGCADALREVASGPCGFDEATRKLAADVPADPLRTAAQVVLASLQSGNVTAVEPYLGDGTIRIATTCSVCDEDIVHTSTYDAAAFRTHVGEADHRQATSGTYVGPALLFCEGHCCSGPTGGLTHSTTSVTSVCFGGSDIQPTLASISALSG